MIGSCSYIWFDRRSEMHRFEKAASLVNLEQALYIIIFLLIVSINNEWE